MPYVTWSDGDVPTAAQVNANFRDQVISTVTSGTRPSGTEGQMIYETDTELLRVYSGAAWSTIGPAHGALTAYTPVVGGTGWALGNGTASGAYARLGRWVFCRGIVTFGGTSTFGAGGLTISLPVAASTVNQALMVFMTDTGTASYPGAMATAAASTTGTILVWGAGATYVTNGGVSSAIPFTWVSTDKVEWSGCYEANATA